MTNINILRLPSGGMINMDHVIHTEDHPEYIRYDSIEDNPNAADEGTPAPYIVVTFDLVTENGYNVPVPYSLPYTGNDRLKILAWLNAMADKTDSWLSLYAQGSIR